MFNWFRNDTPTKEGNIYKFFKDTVRVDLDQTVRGRNRWVVYKLVNGRFTEVDDSLSLDDALNLAKEVK